MAGTIMEGIIPDFSNCIKDKNGDIWCFEPETESVVRVILERPIFTTIPQEVLFQLLKAENKKRNDQ